MTNISSPQLQLHRMWAVPEIVSTIAPLVGKSLLAFRATCPFFRECSERAYTIYRKQLFIDRYGAIPECEKDIPLTTLIERVQSSSRFDTAVGIDLSNLISEVRSRTVKEARGVKNEPNPWLEIDDQGVPQFVDYQKRFFEGKVSPKELFKAKFRFYRRRDFQVRDNQVEKLIALQDKVAKELDEQSLKASHPLQDLRDRCRRLQTLRDERDSLRASLSTSYNCYENFLRTLTPEEKVVFTILCFAQKAYTQKLKVDALPVSFLNLVTKVVKLGATKILFQGREIPIEIQAEVGWESGLDDRLDFSGKTTFCLFQPYTNQTLGFFAIKRTWRRGDLETGYEPHFSEKDPKAKGNTKLLTNRRLYILPFFIDYLGQDQATGDRPMMRLMTQIAVEIFQLESEDFLEIGTNGCDADVFVAGGFLSSPIEVMNSLKLRLGLAREQGLLFPDDRDNQGTFSVSLKKSPSNPVTQFVAEERQSARVDFSLDQPPITWEEQIRTHRLLSITQGPILPKFFMMDLHRFEHLPVLPTVATAPSGTSRPFFI